MGRKLQTHIELRKSFFLKEREVGVENSHVFYQRELGVALLVIWDAVYDTACDSLKGAMSIRGICMLNLWGKFWLIIKSRWFLSCVRVPPDTPPAGNSFIIGVTLSGQHSVGSKNLEAILVMRERHINK